MFLLDLGRESIMTRAAIASLMMCACTLVPVGQAQEPQSARFQCVSGVSHEGAI